jgi:hypothetical protein
MIIACIMMEGSRKGTMKVGELGVVHEFHDQIIECWDDVSGESLDPAGVKKARKDKWNNSDNTEYM